MKRYIVTSYEANQPIHISVVVGFDVYTESGDTNIAASTYRGYWVPDGAVISGLSSDVIDSQAFLDFESFMESVTNLLTDYYDLHIYYKNVSPDHSHYFGMLAKDDSGRVIIDFDFTLRVANHNAHRTEQSMKHKKEQKAALKKTLGGQKTKNITVNFKVNNETFNSYLDAFEAIDNIVDTTLEKMKKNEQYRRKQDI